MNTTTLLASAIFAGGLTVTADLSAVYRCVSSYSNGTALAEYIGTLADISDSDYATLAGDDRARCTVA